MPDPLTATLDAVNVLWVEGGKELKREEARPRKEFGCVFLRPVNHVGYIKAKSERSVHIITVDNH